MAGRKRRFDENRSRYDGTQPEEERLKNSAGRLGGNAFPSAYIAGVAETAMDAGTCLAVLGETRVSRALRRILVDFATHPFIRFATGIYGREPRAGSYDMALFFRTMSLLTKSGLTISEALDTAVHHMPDSILAREVATLLAKVNAGETLASGMRECRSFPWYVRAVVRAGEMSDSLERQFDSLASHYERSLHMSRTVASIMVYPSLVLVVACAVTLFMSYVILPEFARFYEDFSGGEAQLPLLTRNVLEGSRFIVDNIRYALFAPFIPLVWRFLRNLSVYRPMFDALSLRIPIFGGIARRANIVRIFRTVQTLKENGLTLDDALLAAIEQTNNVHYKRSLVRMRSRVMGGGNLGMAMTRERVYPPLIRTMLKKLDAGCDCDSFKLVADFYERELDLTVRSLVLFVEPAVMVAIGMIVGVCILALYLPIFNLVDVIK